MTEQLANFGHTTLAEALDDSETGVDVTAGSVFPASGDFRVLVDSEIMKVTARATNTLTVERGAEGTTAASHSNGADIDARLTAEGLRQMMSEARGIPNGVISTKAYHNTTQGSLAASGFNALDLNSEDWDTDNLHDPSTNNSRITIKTAGKYLLHGSSYVTQTWVPYLKLNGTQIGAGTDTTINQIGEVSLVLDLAVDDYVEFAEYHGSGTATAGHASATELQTKLSATLLGSGNVAGLDTDSARRTSGDLTLNSTSWADVDTGMDLVVAAQVGDVLLVNIGIFWGNENVQGNLDAATIVSSSPVNYVSGGATWGVQGWQGINSETETAGSGIQYTVVAGDIEGGTVTLRLRYKTDTATNKTLRAASAYPLQWSVVNLRQGSGIFVDEDNHLPWVIDLSVYNLATNTNWSSISASAGNYVTDWNRASSGAQNDEVEWPVILAAGTWTVAILIRKASNVGIFSVQLDGVEKGTIDGYASSGTPAQLLSVTGITVATTGKYTLKLKMATKNGSSSGYYGIIDDTVRLLRTA